jgi:F5/8 type C domain/Alpha-L-fucosidase
MKKNNIKEKKTILALIILMLLFLHISISSGTATEKNRAEWLHDAKWGVFTHYLAEPGTPASIWNERVNNFDVKYLAQQLSSFGAKYYFITLGQNSGHYCSPNAKYDRFLGVQQSKCSSRDLIADLSKALKPLGIKLLVYLPSGAPSLDGNAVEKLKWLGGPHKNKEFQNRWESVIKEWSLRWGNSIDGWWFDGAYWPKVMYDSVLPPNFQSFAAAARAGNSKSIVAFNPGVLYPIITQTEHEDYTAGEIEEPWGVECKGRWVGKTQFHILSYLGSYWGKGSPRYSSEKVIQITNNINSCGGVVTWDVPVQDNGHIPELFVTQLIELNRGNKNQRMSMRPKTAKLPRNLAIYKKAKMLSLDGEKILPVNSAKYFSQLGVDGDLKTFAMAGNEWAWIYQVDLEKTYDISKIKLTFGENFATSYEIFVSKDRIKWSKLVQNNTSNGGLNIHTFRPIKARYVNLKAIKPDGPNQVGGQMSIAELEVYR